MTGEQIKHIFESLDELRHRQDHHQYRDSMVQSLILAVASVTSGSQNLTAQQLADLTTRQGPLWWKTAVRGGLESVCETQSPDAMRLNTLHTKLKTLPPENFSVYIADLLEILDLAQVLHNRAVAVYYRGYDLNISREEWDHTWRGP